MALRKKNLGDHFYVQTGKGLDATENQEGGAKLAEEVAGVVLGAVS